MDPDYDFTGDAYNNAYENTQKHVWQDDGFTNSLGPAGTHNLHDDHKHGATENERSEENMHLGSKPGNLTIAKTQERELFKFVICRRPDIC